MIGVVEEVNRDRNVFCVRGNDRRYIYFRVEHGNLPAVGDSIAYAMPLPEREVPFENITAGDGIRRARTAVPNLPRSAALVLTR